MAIAVTPTREITCPGCGRRRLISDRNARRNPQTCNLCRHPNKRKPPNDSDRRFWLKRFSDKDIVEMAYWIFETEGDIDTVRHWRATLLPNHQTVEDVLVKGVLKRLYAKETHELLSPNGEAKLRQ